LKASFVILPVLALMLGVSAWAQAPKIAVIDMQGALLSTKEGQKAAEELKLKFGPREEEFNTRQKELVAKQDAYRKTMNTISATAKASMEREIDAAQKALERDADDAKQDFSAEQNRLLGGIMQKMQAVMTKYAADNQITMIVDVSSQPNNLLYADQASNISTAIITAFDNSAAAPAAAPAGAPAKPAAAPAPKPAAPRPAGVK
jgi:outer membrane protein